MVIVLGFSTPLNAFAFERYNAFSLDDIQSSVSFLKKDISDTCVKLNYYMTNNGKCFLVSESLTKQKNTLVSFVETVEVDSDKNPIESTRTYTTNTLQIDYGDLNIHSDKLNLTDGQIVNYSAFDKWKPYSATYSLSGAQFTVLSVATLLAGSTGMGLPAATTAAAGMLSVLTGYGAGKIPDSIYFTGQRCMHRSTGKIYYRYRGNFYTDSSKSKLLFANISWSRRVGH